MGIVATIEFGSKEEKERILFNNNIVCIQDTLLSRALGLAAA